MAIDFVSRRGTQFLQKGKPYRFVGANFWQGLHLALTNTAQLDRELDLLEGLGISNLRIMAAFEGPDNAPWRATPSLQPHKGVFEEPHLEALDYLIEGIGRRNMTAVICLGNFWPWSGGMAQYLAWEGKGPIPFPPPAEGGSWSKYMLFTSRFFKHAAARTAYAETVKRIISRQNSITALPYAEDPTIMTWQLANEPRAMLHRRAYCRWITETAKLIRQLAPQQLVSLGSEGRTATFLSGTRPLRDHRLTGIDYVTCHIWPQNWGWYDPESHKESFPKALQKARPLFAPAPTGRKAVK